ncbi:MAG: patatin-like phospholipase family protein [Bacteroidales bacterium]|nr:patatin-like phospholipase family protein [Bacteroidaceae bacterium]MDO4185081.1 patatin-like phospholipase family protein [Bacteroidales bacterium]
MEKHIAKPNIEYPTGFALSGGFIKGFAHLGAIQALLEHDIKPDILSGVSAGALAGALYADGNEPYQVLEFFKGLTFRDLTNLVLPRSGFFDLTEVIDFLKAHLKATRLEDLKIPMVITATDFDHGHSVHFREGELAEIIAASCCVPILFTPVTIDGTHYVDGGVLMNLPVSPIRDVCQKVVAINVSPLVAPEYKLNILSIAERAYHFMFRSNTVSERAKADLLIEPTDLYEFSDTDLDKTEEIFMRGYSEAKETLSTLDIKH